jgi:hypothetical protein
MKIFFIKYSLTFSFYRLFVKLLRTLKELYFAEKYAEPTRNQEMLRRINV